MRPHGGFFKLHDQHVIENIFGFLRHSSSEYHGQMGQPGRQLPGAAVADAEESLGGLAVAVAQIHVAEHVQNFWKVFETTQIGQAVEMPPVRAGKGPIRQYVIFRRSAAGEYE